MHGEIWWQNWSFFSSLLLVLTTHAPKLIYDNMNCILFLGISAKKQLQSRFYTAKSMVSLDLTDSQAEMIAGTSLNSFNNKSMEQNS